MSVSVIELWNQVPSVTLIANRQQKETVMPKIDPSAAFLLRADQARDAGILPFRREDGCLWVAAAEPLSPAAWALLDPLGPIRIYRTVLIDLLMAQWQVYGEGNESPPLFGEIAVKNFSLNPQLIDQALAAQHQQKGPIGQACMTINLLNSWQVATVLSEQTGIPLNNLLDTKPPDHPNLDDIWSLLTKEEWRHYAMVPIRHTSQEILIAVVNPFDNKGPMSLAAKTDKRITLTLTGERDIAWRLASHYQEQDLNLSQSHLLSTSPENSATKTLTRSQSLTLLLMSLLIIVMILWRPQISLSVISSMLILAYATLVGHRLWIINKGTQSQNDLRFTAEDLQKLKDSDLPMYTILIPARDEAAVLPIMTQALEQLDYPGDRLDVKLLLEEDDETTLAAARQAHLPHFVEIVVVPVAEPRTKPKACNFGLQRARGEFITIYDAEDLPDPLQLKKALLAFREKDSRLACVQAKLSYFNANQNLLTRWFTAEYGAWFDLLLPALHAADMPIPLGGTSNHFRTRVLKEIGAWDRYNVTEDADLGIRLHKAGYRTLVMDSITYEEANSEFINWIRQRSRWIKGYLQTWFVHMRHPLQLRRQLGRKGFWGFHLAILGTPLMFILNPVYWFITSLWFMTHWDIIPHLFPPGIYYLGMINLLIGNFAFTYLNIVGAAKRGHWDLIPYAILTPIYWSMMSLASWKALIQLITRPSHWEKTQHGLVDWKKIGGQTPNVVGQEGSH